MNFIDLLDEYVLGKVDKEGLCKHIKQMFNQLFDEYKFMELEYLKIYPFLSHLQDEDLYETDILQREIEEIKGILSGQKLFLYDMWINLNKRDIGQIEQIWSNYKEKGMISFEELEFLQNIKLHIMLNTRTIEAICWEKLLTLLIGLPTVDDDFCTYNLLYAKEIDKVSIRREVERLIDILEGKNPVHILLRYEHTDFACSVL